MGKILMVEAYGLLHNLSAVFAFAIAPFALLVAALWWNCWFDFQFSVDMVRVVGIGLGVGALVSTAGALALDRHLTP